MIHDDRPNPLAYIRNWKRDHADRIVWTGDLDDDCTARWCGLTLCAEAMDEDSSGNGTDWWWAVYESASGHEETVQLKNCWGDGDMDGDGDGGGLVPNSNMARAAAENAARRIVESR